MSGGNRSDSPAKKALQEHRVLLKLFHSIIEFVSRQRRPAEEVVEKLVNELKDLRRQLESHFEREEESGLFEAILERVPTAEAAVQDLRREHVGFLETVTSLILRLQHPNAEQFNTVRRDLKRFFRAFATHEHTENDLLERAYFRDVGGAD